MAYVSKEIYRNVDALDAILAAIKAKGGKSARRDSKVEIALKSLSIEAQQELLDLVYRITFSFNYENNYGNIRLRAKRNQRRVTRDYQSARVANFFAANPDHPLTKGATVRTFNYWERY